MNTKKYAHVSRFAVFCGVLFVLDFSETIVPMPTTPTYKGKYITQID